MYVHNVDNFFTLLFCTYRNSIIFVSTKKIKNMKKVTKRFTKQGFQARCKTGQDPKQVYVTWHNPNGCEINDWDNDNVAIFEELLVSVKVWCVANDLTLWSY